MPGPAFISIVLAELQYAKKELTCKFAHQAFAGGQAGDDPSASDALKHVFAVPSNKMAVIDDISLALVKLYS